MQLLRVVQRILAWLYITFTEGRFITMGRRNWLLLLVLVGSVSLLVIMSRDLPQNHNQDLASYGVDAIPVGKVGHNSEHEEDLELQNDMNLNFDGSIVGGTLVHLDLKGAPPKMSYYREIFPLFKTLGATGLLIEYEDMFPYSGNLQVLAANNAYTVVEIKEILNLAAANGLTVIPLVQTFGHMEFVLKHARFSHLREVPNNPQGIHPVLDESRTLVYDIISQVLALHPNVTHIHLGGDEVYTLGKSPASEDFMRKNGVDKSGLYLHHVVPVLQFVKDNFKVKPIMWDDMMRKITLENLQSSRLGSLVEPMVWVYLTRISDRVNSDVWLKYSQVFSNVWTASAFKGATGRRQFITDINHHRQNHESWLKTIYRQKKYFSRFQGMVLTGWQRYDHFAPLCELLPVGLPSLAICLQTVLSHSFDANVHQHVSEMLKCEGPLELHLDFSNSEYSKCHFPGSEIYEKIHQLYTLRNHFDQQRWRYQMYVGDYGFKHRHVNGFQINEFVVANKTYMDATVRSLSSTLPVLLSEIYHADLVEEWMEDNIYGPYKEANDLYAKVKPLTQVDTWQPRPYPETPLQ